MERHGQIRCAADLEGTDVPCHKVKAGVIQLSGHCVAELDHIGFQIHAIHDHFAATNAGKIIIERKAQIALAAAQIQNVQLIAGDDAALHIRNDFQEAVDLAEFGALLIKNPTLFILHTQRHQKVHRLIIRNDILLFPVMLQLHGGSRIALDPVQHGDFSLLGHFHFAVSVGREDIHCLILAGDHIRDLLGSSFGGQVLVQRLTIGAKPLQRQIQFSLDLHQPAGGTDHGGIHGFAER